MITLEQLKLRPLVESESEKLYRLRFFSDWNIRVFRLRMADPEKRKYCLWEITHNGNDLRENEDILKEARKYIEHNVYTDKEWEEYIIPFINKMIEYNDSFIRWYPGYLLRQKSTGVLAILEYDYATAFGTRDFKHLSICELDKDGNIACSWSWAYYNMYELVDNKHTKENIAKIREWRKGDTIPYHLSTEMINLYYT